jgi:O-antigen ligase/tetratricopeptide (TPR) repeat protein
MAQTLASSGIRVARGVVLLLVVLVPVAFWRGTVEAFEVNKLALLQLAALALTALLVPALLRSGGMELGRGLVPLGAGLLVLSGSLSTLTSVSPWTSLLGAHESLAGLATFVPLLVVLLAGRALVRDAEDAFPLIAALVVPVAPISVYALLQAGGLDPLGWCLDSPFASWSRPFGTLGHPNFLAAWLVTTLPLLVHCVRVAAARKRPLVVVGLVVTGLLGLGALALTLSRGGWLAGGAAALVLLGGWVLAQRSRKRRWVAIALLTGLLLGGVVVLSRIPLLGERVRGLWISPERWQIWQTAWLLFLDRPLLGSGPDTFQIVFGSRRTVEYWLLEWNLSPTRAHNEVLHLLATQGIVSGLALLVFLAGLVRAGWRALRSHSGEQRSLALVIVAGLVGFLVQDLFSFTVVGAGVVFALLAGILSRLGEGGPAHTAPAAGGSRGERWVVLAGTFAGARLLLVNLGELANPWSFRSVLCAGLFAAGAGLGGWTWWRLTRAGGESESPGERSAQANPGRRPWLAGLGWLGGAATLALCGVGPAWVASALCRSGEETLESSGRRALPLFEQAAWLAPHQEIYHVKLAQAAQECARREGSQRERRRFQEQARAALEQASRLAPTNPAHPANLGRLLAWMASEDPDLTDQALASFDLALGQDPLNTCTLADAANAALTLQQRERARAWLRQGLAVDPEQATLWVGGGRLAAAYGQLEAAEWWLNEAAWRKNWHGDQDACARGWAMLARVLLLRGRAREACATAEGVLAQRPDWPELLVTRAEALERLGQPREAGRAWAKLLQVQPGHPAALAGMRRVGMAGSR